MFFFGGRIPHPSLVHPFYQYIPLSFLIKKKKKKIIWKVAMDNRIELIMIITISKLIDIPCFKIIGCYGYSTIVFTVFVIVEVLLWAPLCCAVASNEIDRLYSISFGLLL